MAKTAVKEKSVKSTKTENISPLKAYLLMKKSKGTIFTVEFIKKDNTIRKMNCRMGVKQGLTGKGMAYDPADKEKLCVYDVQKGSYRMINLDNMLTLKLAGKTYKIDRFV